MKILIIEDELLIIELLKSILEDLGYTLIFSATSYSKALLLLEDVKPDFILIDISLLGQKTGIDFANNIVKKYQIPFIYITGNTKKETLNLAKLSDPYAILIKPIDPDELSIAIDLALFKHSKKSQYNHQANAPEHGVYIKDKDAYIRIEYKDILYVKSQSVYIKIFTSKDKVYTNRIPISEFKTKLNPNIFKRVHRSYIVNIQHVNKIQASSIIINNQYIPLGKKYKDQLFNQLNIN